MLINTVIDDAGKIYQQAGLEVLINKLSLKKLFFSRINMGEKGEKIYAFIDSQNLNLSVQKDIINSVGNIIYKGWKLNFRRLYVYLRDKYKVEKAYLFIGRVVGNEPLYRYLEDSGYLVIYKPTLEYSGGKEKIIKGNVDAELVLHTMIEFPNFDKAIIVSGDGDYFCLIDYLETKNKLANIMIPNKKSYSSLLRQFNRYFVFITDLREKLEDHQETTKKRE